MPGACPVRPNAIETLRSGTGSSSRQNGEHSRSTATSRTSVDDDATTPSDLLPPATVCRRRKLMVLDRHYDEPR